RRRPQRPCGCWPAGRFRPGGPGRRSAVWTPRRCSRSWPPAAARSPWRTIFRPMTAREKLRLRTRVKDLGSRLGWHVVPARDYDIARRDYYSPLPDFDAVAPEVWERESPLRGIEFDVDAQFHWAEQNLAPYAREFHPPAHGDLSAPEFFLINWSMQAGDAELLYAMVRHAKPARIIELGSGFSTLAMAQ